MKTLLLCALLLPLITFSQVKDSLDKKQPVSVELRKQLLAETKKGCKLDFFTPIKGKEYEGVQVKPGLISTNLGMALYKWGHAVADSGVTNVNDALSIFTEFKGRPLNPRETGYISKGFYKELDEYLQ
jgi:hypothetical protein